VINPMLPNLIVIGGAKCGTTSLHYYLSLHPEIFMSKLKELNFFVEEESWPKGLAWYESNFDASTKTIRGESSPLYTRYPILRGVPERMHSIVPDAKLIYVLRDPMERLISQIVDDLSTTDLYPDVHSAIFPFEKNSSVMSSLQCLQLEQYLPYYKLSQILLLTAEELSRKRAETMARVFRFLGVDETFTSREFSFELNPRSVKRERSLAQMLVKRFLALRPGRFLPFGIGVRAHYWMLKASAPPLKNPTLETEVEAQLLEMFHEDAERLRRLTGLKLEGWRV
jgi:hypothetical protein